MRFLDAFEIEANCGRARRNSEESGRSGEEPAITVSAQGAETIHASAIATCAATCKDDSKFSATF